MSINELEAKCRELRQLQALIEEAQAEAEAIKDTLKAAMGDSEAVQAGEYKITWKAVKTLQNRHHGPETGNAGRCTGIYQGNHHPALLRGMRKAPCVNAYQAAHKRPAPTTKGRWAQYTTGPPE